MKLELWLGLSPQRRVLSGTTPGPVLDGTSPTGAFSFSRQLLSSYSGDFYADTAGAITTCYDQSEIGDLTDGGIATQRPALTTAGPNSIACADFDGSSDFLTSGVARNGATSRYYVVSVIFDVIDTASKTALSDGANPANAIFALDSGGVDHLWGQHQATDGLDQLHAAGAVGAVYVLSLRVEGGLFYFRINNGTELSTSCGNSTSVVALAMGRYNSGFPLLLNGKIFEAATWGTPPNEATRDSIEQGLMAHVGA